MAGRAVLREGEEMVTERHDDDDGDYLFSISVGHNENATPPLHQTRAL